MQETNENEDDSDLTMFEVSAHSPETTENNDLNTCTIKSLKLRISCCVLMCKLKQEMIITN